MYLHPAQMILQSRGLSFGGKASPFRWLPKFFPKKMKCSTTIMAILRRGESLPLKRQFFVLQYHLPCHIHLFRIYRLSSSNGLSGGEQTIHNLAYNSRIILFHTLCHKKKKTIEIYNENTAAQGINLPMGKATLK